MMNSYKDQFTEWSPAYPVVFHDFKREVDESAVVISAMIAHLSLKTHNKTINAINKAMKK